MWLNYVSSGVNIQHALNGGEKKLTIDNKTYKVDGFCEKTNTVYEFYGCFWHGCPKCYKPNIVNSKNQKDNRGGGGGVEGRYHWSVSQGFSCHLVN